MDRHFMLKAVRIWDLPTRLFHWLLALDVVALIATGELSGDDMVWHYRLGYLALALVLFRVIWGFAGGHWSRFAHFVTGPGRILAYLRQSPNVASAGHNPLGALSILSMLLLLLVQLVSGMACEGETGISATLASLLSDDMLDSVCTYHAHTGKKLLVLLIMLHLTAIAFYRLRRGIDLVRPMLTGDKQLEDTTPASRDDARHGAWALLVFALCAALVLALLAL